MDRIRVKCLQVGLIIALLVGLAVNAKPLPKPEVTPRLTAGAAKLPMVDYRTITPKVKDPDPEIMTVAAVEEAAGEETAGPAAGSGEDPEGLPEAAGEDLPEAAGASSVGEPTELNYDEIDILYRTVQAEGYTIGVEGMQLITDAILNLARDRGCSINDVLCSGAYTVVNNGAIWRQSIYPETITAVDAEIGGDQIDYSIKYFRTGHYHGFGSPAFRYGNVYFSS